jgi:hypothetical protein
MIVLRSILATFEAAWTIAKIGYFCLNWVGSQTWANDHLQTTNTCQQQPQIWSPKVGRYTQVWLYFKNLQKYIHISVKHTVISDELTLVRSSLSPRAGTIVFNFPYSRLNEHLRFFLFELSPSLASSTEKNKIEKY